MRWLCVAAALAASVLPAQADISVVISKSQQRMAVTIDGGAPQIWAVSTGRDGYDTPSGNYHAIRLEEVYYSKKYDDAPMPNSVFFYGGYAIHGTLEERRLGSAVSHGCVRLARSNAAYLFSMVRQQGMSRTRITITDGPLPYAGTPMARGGYDGRGYGSYGGYDRSLAARSAPGRYDNPPPTIYRGFDQFGGRAEPRYLEPRYDQPRYSEPRYRVEDQPRSRYRDMPPPGREYSEAEIRRMMRDGGWR